MPESFPPVRAALYIRGEVVRCEAAAAKVDQLDLVQTHTRIAGSDRIECASCPIHVHIIYAFIFIRIYFTFIRISVRIHPYI
jgi:hypothetical protein